MNKIEQNQNGLENGYKSLLLRAKQLRSKGGKSAWERAKILVAVFDDQKFRTDCGNIDDFRAAEILDDYVDDLALGFLDLRAMLKHFPERKTWMEGRLRRLYNQMLKEMAAAKVPKQPRQKVAETRKQLERQVEETRREAIRAKAAAQETVAAAAQTKKQLEQVVAETKQQATAKEREAETLQDEVNRLRARVRELLTDNERLRRRVAELEADLEQIEESAAKRKNRDKHC